MTSTRTDEKAEQKTSAGAPSGRPKRIRHRSVSPSDQKGTPEAKRTAAVLLDVLAGARRPIEAAEALGVSTMRYYVLESRGIAGLIAGCEPRPAGHPANPAQKVAALTREIDKLRQEIARYQALARAAQRALGVAPPKPATEREGGTKRRRRKPTVTALRVARELRHSVPQAVAPTESVLAAKVAP